MSSQRAVTRRKPKHNPNPHTTNMLSNRDLNIERSICDRKQSQSTPIKSLTKTTKQLNHELKEIETRIEQRLRSIDDGTQFRDSNVDVVAEFNELKHDRFWRSEIETRLTEHLDELEARKILRAEKINHIKKSTESSPSKRDMEFAQNLIDTERQFQLANRQREDQDEMSRIMAKCMQDEENKANDDKKSISMISKMMQRLRGNGRK